VRRRFLIGLINFVITDSYDRTKCVGNTVDHASLAEICETPTHPRILPSPELPQLT
jgi:hypothetical protein